jgi:exosortase/archaeosortase family protein
MTPTLTTTPSQARSKTVASPTGRASNPRTQRAHRGAKVKTAAQEDHEARRQERRGAMVLLMYLAWAIAAAPFLIKLAQTMGLWDIYRINLLAPCLAYSCTVRCMHDRVAERPWKPALTASGMALTLIGGLMSGGSLTIASLTAVVGLILMHRGVLGSPLRSPVHAGLLLMVFAIVIPVELLESIASILNKFHAELMEPLLSTLLTMEAYRQDMSILIPDGTWVHFVRECAGLTSMLGLLLFSTYFAVCFGLGWKIGSLLLFSSLVLSLLLNQIRALSTGIFYAADAAFWSTELGHELLGFLMLALGLAVLRGMAGRLLIHEPPASADSGGPS